MVRVRQQKARPGSVGIARYLTTFFGTLGRGNIACCGVRNRMSGYFGVVCVAYYSFARAVVYERVLLTFRQWTLTLSKMLGYIVVGCSGRGVPTNCFECSCSIESIFLERPRRSGWMVLQVCLRSWQPLDYSTKDVVGTRAASRHAVLRQMPKRPPPTAIELQQSSSR